jgi:hypothetical protein
VATEKLDNSGRSGSGTTVFAKALQCSKGSPSIGAKVCVCSCFEISTRAGGDKQGSQSEFKKENGRKTSDGGTSVRRSYFFHSGNCHKERMS